MHQALIAWNEPTSTAAEAFRQLRAMVESSPPGMLRTLGAVTPSSGEGKATALANLGIALAQGGKRVILVDGDLRTPSLHTLFETDNTVGVTSVLREETALLEALRDSGVPQLSVLPGGPADPNAHLLLTGPKVTHLLQDLKARADYVLLDLPAVLERSDALVLAPLLDGVFLVLKAGRSKREESQRAKTLLQQVNAKVLGILFTNATQ